ncbi:MAG: GDSL-type esterase/lipase family protein [Spirulinaceae cyanobacterium]
MQTLFPPNFAPTPQSQSQPLKLIALGDSLIYGFGDPVGGGWVERLRRQWMSSESPGHVLYNLGIRGDGVIQVSQRLEQEFRTRGELRNSLPDLIMLSVGVNDSPRLGHSKGKHFTEEEVFQYQLAQLLDRAKGLCPVLFVGMVPVNEQRMPFLDCLYYSHQNQYLYKEMTRKACEERKIPYLDIFDLWLKRGKDWLTPHLSADGLHPNVQGYQALLQDVLAWEPVARLNYLE